MMAQEGEDVKPLDPKEIVEPTPIKRFNVSICDENADINENTEGKANRDTGEAEKEAKEPVIDMSCVGRHLQDAYLFRLPRAFTYMDYIWPGLLISPDKLCQLQNFEFRTDDILIVSYPKSGTTWVSEIVSLLCHKADVDQVKKKPLHERVPWLELDHSYAWIRFFWVWQFFKKLFWLKDEEVEQEETKVRRVFFTHLPLELLPKQALNGRCQIVYIARNPKDNAVSFFHFHQMARFLGLQKTTWEEFFPLYTFGMIYCGSWFEHVLSYWKFSKINPRMIFLKYEDMKKNLNSEVRRLSNFLGIKLSDEETDRVVHHSTFGTMKNNRMANRAGVWLFDQSISNFMRKGVVGDWMNYFTLNQNELFDQVYGQKMKNEGLAFEFNSIEEE